MSTYADFIAHKTQEGGNHGFAATGTPEWLYPFQKHLVEWAVLKGRGAIFADCGLGKTPMQLAWADEIHRHTGKPVLIMTPLAVAQQTVEEAHKFGYDAAQSRDGKIPAAITVTNYERLHHFDTTAFGGVVCDESSAIKAFDGERRREVTDFMRKHRYRLLCTATAAPNDYIELGTSSEALGELGYTDMLGRFFVNNMNNSVGQRGYGQAAKWRFKGHAQEGFWRWVASWAIACRKPSDIGFNDDRFVLPELHVRQTIINATKPHPERLFDVVASGLSEEREEQRRTLVERCEAAAEVLAHDEAGVAWCQLNAEGDLLTKLIPGAVQIKGGDDIDKKEEALAAFSRGDIRVLVTKPVIGAWGLNWQHCRHMTFFPSHSYEQYYQSVRRSWRFGQTEPVRIDIITTEGGAGALENLQRKAEQADAMFASLTANMHRAVTIARKATPTEERITIPSWV